MNSKCTLNVVPFKTWNVVLPTLLQFTLLQVSGYRQWWVREWIRLTQCLGVRMKMFVGREVKLNGFSDYMNRIQPSVRIYFYFVLQLKT